MEKKDVKNILISMRTHENETVVNNLLGQIDLMQENQFQEMINRLENTEGNLETAVRKELSEEIDEMILRNDEQKPINSLFTYGISGNSVHLHLPGIMQIKGGITRKLNTANLYLVDAIEKAAQMKQRFTRIEKIYMISPILTFRIEDKETGKVKFDELGFLENLGFETDEFSAQQLNDQDFIDKNPEAMLAKKIFGSKKAVGRAIIDIDRITTPEWQAKKQELIETFKQMGIFLEEASKSKTQTENGEGEEPEQ